MAAILLDGRTVARAIRGEVAEGVARLKDAAGFAPRLAAVLVGDDPASRVYVRNKIAACAEVGIRSEEIRLPPSARQQDVLETVRRLSGDADVDGILVQLPLPRGLDRVPVLLAVDPEKDVDGLHPLNAGQLLLGEPAHVGATPAGILALLEEYEVPIEGARAVVVGRSDIVGKPTALLLLHANATVTICHSRTADLAARAREADILVVAVGKAGVIGADDVREGATVIDVGMNRTDEGLRGDLDPAAAERAGLLTPVPGGVGPMTIAMLLRSAVRAARYRRGLLAFPGA